MNKHFICAECSKSLNVNVIDNPDEKTPKACKVCRAKGVRLYESTRAMLV